MTSTDGNTAHWVAVDWGTSHLRLWLMDEAGSALQRFDSDKGMGCLTPDAFEPVLTDLLAAELSQRSTPLQVVCCGMAGSRQGWSEAPYATAPCAPPSIEQATKVATHHAGLTVRILPGVKQDTPADVMRGEETQIAGVIAAQPGFDGVICLPGTHTKWVRVADGRIQGFSTFMTGELFALISKQSVLRHTVGAAGWDEQVFVDAVTHTVNNPSALTADMFALRAKALVADLEPTAARARLSGLLVGAELAASEAFWRSGDLAIVGESGLASAYRTALFSQNRDATILNAEDMTLGGLRAAYEHLKEVEV